MKGSSTSGSRIAPRFSAARKFQSSSTQDEEISLNIIGTVFKLKSSATIKDIKTMLRNKYGFPENHLEFFLAGQPLMDFQRVVDCGFLECAVDLVFKNIVGMKLFVKLPSSTIEIEGKAEDTIQKVKAMIQAKEKIQPDQFTLVYDGKFLEEDMTLASLRMKNESTLYMVSAPKYILSISVKAPSGETFKFKVKPLFTVRDVKTIVESYTGCSVSDHNLIYSGNELEDLKTLAFYDIEDESVLEVSPRSLQIFVKVCDGKIITVDVKQSDSVKELKSKIFRKLNVSMMPFDFYKLVFRGEQLDEVRDLASYNIRRGSKLRLVLSSSVIVRD
ncbi:polyubiquitin-like isoform X1 [Rosa rugosa]|uniref:polyubiquitin-like isoform X1 n=1 Tax=Rosa rugosa TaxID=74645 RepID=UPI002B406326|nr:polyubiquitin-like isoform X1 [Rosa rugosa]